MNRVVLVVLAAALAARSEADNDSATSSDALFSGYLAVISGGYAGIQGDASRLLKEAVYSCGYRDGLAHAEAVLDALSHGGNVTVDTEDQWCSWDSSAGGASCLTRLGDGVFVFDRGTPSGPGMPSQRYIDVVIELEGGRYALFESFYALAFPSAAVTYNYASALQEDADIPPSGACPGSEFPVFEPADIHGVWSGNRVVYDRVNKTGHSEIAHSMTCTAEGCRIETHSLGLMGHEEFVAPGAWYMTEESVRAGAVMSHDAQALAVWVCPESGGTQRLPDCSLYGFTRAAE